MRELKFRAWCPKCNRFEPISLWEKDSLSVEDNFSEWLDDLSIEQYTGLKDKNGKEIYEGDICRLIYSERGDGRKRWKNVNEDIELVEFEDGYFKFSNTDQYGTGSELSFSDYGEWAIAGGQYKYEAMVIGNIHENPELLEGK